MSSKHKIFFENPTPGQIKSLDEVIDIPDEFVHRILKMNDSTGGIITSEIIPTSEFKDSKRFMKYGPRVPLRTFSSVNEAINVRPVDMRREAFEQSKKNGESLFSGYVVFPFEGDDRRPRKFSLTECLEGARIYAYVHQQSFTNEIFKPHIYIEEFDEKKESIIESGAEIILKVPSRTRREGRHKFKFLSVPIYSSKEMWEFAHNLDSTHVCDSKLYNIRNIQKQGRKGSKEVNFCAHEVAGYLEIMKHYNDSERNNIIPAQMNPFAVPTQFTVSFYNMLLNNILIKTPDRKNTRELHQGEKEILLWNLVQEFGHEKTFYAKTSVDGMVKDYNWRK